MTQTPDEHDRDDREGERSDDADRLNEVALANDATPAAAGASSLPPEDQVDADDEADADASDDA